MSDIHDLHPQKPDAQEKSLKKRGAQLMKAIEQIS